MTITSDQPVRRLGTFLLVLPWKGIEAPGGVNEVVRGLYDAVKQNGGLTSRILLNSWACENAVEDVDSSGRAIVRMRLYAPFREEAIFPYLLRYLVHAPRHIARIWHLLRRYEVKVVNCHFVDEANITWIILRKLGLFQGKIILSVHGADIRSIAKTRGLRRVLWRWMLLNADKVVACSKGIGEEAAVALDLPWSKLVVIHNGIDTRTINRASVACVGSVSPERDFRVIVNVGTFEHKKGQDVLVKAFGRVLECYREAILVIIGRSAESYPALRSLVRELGLEAAVTLITDMSHSETLEQVRASDIFVLSSRNEAFSIALLEAGAMAKPVVATDVCGVSELIQNGVTGIIVPSEDVEALAEGMLSMLNDPRSASELGRKLRDDVENRFSLERACRAYLLVIAQS